MNNKLYDPEIEEGFKMWYGQNSNYPLSNAYNESEFYRSVKQSHDKERTEITSQNKDFAERKKSYQSAFNFAKEYTQKAYALNDMVKEYKLMKSHNYKYLDDYYHCKANYNSTKRGQFGEETAQTLGFAKELVDKFKNRYYKGLDPETVENDFRHDLYVNAVGRARAKHAFYRSAINACADFRGKNPKLPERYW